jgi:hypothetical protein
MSKSWVVAIGSCSIFVMLTALLVAFAYFRPQVSKAVEYDYVLADQAQWGGYFNLPLDAQGKLVSELMSYAKDQGFKTKLTNGPSQHQVNITLEIEGFRWEIGNPFEESSESNAKGVYTVSAYFDVGKQSQIEKKLEQSKTKIFEIFQKNGGINIVSSVNKY